MNIGGKLAGEFMDERRKEGRKEGERRNVLEAVGAAVQLLRRLRVPCICCGDATASLKVEAPPQPLLFRRHHRAHAKRVYRMGVYNRVCVCVEVGAATLGTRQKKIAEGFCRR